MRTGRLGRIPIGDEERWKFPIQYEGAGDELSEDEIDFVRA